MHGGILLSRVETPNTKFSIAWCLIHDKFVKVKTKKTFNAISDVKSGQTNLTEILNVSKRFMKD